MGKASVITCFLIGVVLFAVSASAAESFKCTFGDSNKPCQVLDGKTCQNKFGPRVFATCGNLDDGFICVFTKKPWPTLSDKATVLKAASNDSTALSFGYANPRTTTLVVSYRQFTAERDISQTK